MNRYIDINNTRALSISFARQGKIKLLTPDEVEQAGSLAHRDRAIPSEEMWNRVVVIPDHLNGTFQVVAKPDAEEQTQEAGLDEDSMTSMPFGLLGFMRPMGPR